MATAYDRSPRTAAFDESNARWSRTREGTTSSVVYSGFTTVLDLTLGPDGSLYVLQHSTGPVFFALPGRLLKIAPDGTRSTVIAGLMRPGSVVVGPDGALYVSNRSNAVGTGEVLRIDPHSTRNVDLAPAHPSSMHQAGSPTTGGVT